MAIVTDISCVIPRQDIAQLSEDIRAEFSKRLLGGAPVYPLSSEDILAFVMAGTVNLCWGMVHQVLVQNDPASMCCDNLVRYGAQRGINLASATRAKGYAAITGTPNGLIPATLSFVGESSREYKLDPGVTFNPVRLDANGEAVVRIVGMLGGAIYNVPIGTTLTVSSTTPAIDGTAFVIGNGISGGTNVEDCENLRKRILAAESSGAISTNAAWYIEKTMQYPGVTRVCFDECGECCDPQHIQLYPFFDGVYGDYATPPYGVPPCDVLDAMNDWMWGSQPGMGLGLAPLGIVGAYVTPLPTILEVRLGCVRGCENIMMQRIEDTLRPFLHDNYCVGSRICKDEMRALAFQVSGSGTCFSDISFCTDDGGIRYTDSSYAYLACGRFPVFGSAVLTPCSGERVTLR